MSAARSFCPSCLVQCMLSLCVIFALINGTFASAQVNPVPLINQPLVPMSAAPGGSDFVLTVNGTGFVTESIVYWNGIPLTTNFVTDAQLSAAVPASNVANPGTAAITVVNPAPGGGTSNITRFGVSHPVLPLTFSTFWPVLWNELDGPNALSAVDLNGDGVLDLVTTHNIAGICVQLGKGYGSFQVPKCVGTESYQGAVIVDVNRDGELDLVSPALSSTAVSVFLGNGDGTLQGPIAFATSYSPVSLAAGDFNGDGKIDLAVGQWSGDAAVSVFLGNGDGGFQHLADNPAGIGGAWSVTTGDFNADGKLDIAVVSNDGAYLLLGAGDGTFHSTGLLWTIFSKASIFAVDANADGKLDFIVAQSDMDLLFKDLPDGKASIFLGNGDGTFRFPPPEYLTGGSRPFSLGAGDFDGDGYLDLAISNVLSGTVSILLGNGDGSFRTSLSIPVPQYAGNQGPWDLVVGDFNGDGRPDLAVLNQNASEFGHIAILLNGNFPALATTPYRGLTFGQQAVGTTSAAQTVTLTNTGNAALTLSSIGVAGANASDFAEDNTCGATLLSNATCLVHVTFTPTALGDRSAALRISNDGPGSPRMVNLSGSTTVTPVVALSPLSITFPSQYVGTAGLPQSVTLANTGTGVLNITSVTAVPGDFGVLNACGSSVAPGNNCAIGVFFKPTAGDNRSGTLTITDDASGSPQTIHLSGTGQDFSLGSSSPLTATVARGQTATYTVAVRPGGGFNETVTFSCSGAPLNSTCSLSPTSVALDGLTPASITVTVATAGASASSAYPVMLPRSTRLALWLAFPGLPGVILLSVSAIRRGRPLLVSGLALLGLLLLGIVLFACGGGNVGNSRATSGTPAGKYLLTVSGRFASGSTTMTDDIQLTLVVQ